MMSLDFLKKIKPREYQQKIFNTCLKKNCLVVLPTGIGKTLIALMLSVERLQKYPKEKVVFLAPTKPLVEQHQKSFKKHLPELFAEMTLFTGQIKAEKRKQLWDGSDIVFSTPQCVANDIKKGLYDLKEVSLLIEDEAHRCVKNYDYNYIANNYKTQAKNPRIIGLTASPGNDIEKIKTICQNLSIEEVELRTRESTDVKPYLQDLELEKIKVDFPPEFHELKVILQEIFNSYIEELKHRKVLFGGYSKMDLIELQKKISGMISRNSYNFNLMLAASACAQAIKIQHAIELLETQTLNSFNNYLENLFDQAKKRKSKGAVKLAENPKFNYIYAKTKEMISQEINHPKIEKIRELVEKEISNNRKAKLIIFTQYRDTAQEISKTLNSIENINSKVFVGQAKKSSGSGKNQTSTGLSQKEQKQIIEEFSEGKINILCATCIAEEGLDIPEVNAVVFYETIPSAIRAIQRAGRTARLKKGKLILLITKKTRDETFYHISKSREKKMNKAINSIKEDLSNNKLNFKEKQKKLF